ncbi:hypothetical protein AC1031_016605 [Aphanomyces cochlioides]|nr:hypothetical protein AC1031_016604 [Aphanomyces cochlioides]KAG9397812.1 hypothetical protein AC1031_016605 [Aphanomyces cochlioides]
MAMSSEKKRYRWDNDGVNGGPTSLQVLLEWLTVEGNYHKWRGGDRSGLTKEALCGQIVGRLVDVGIAHRKPADIRDKIQNLEMQYRTAVDWLAATGQGIEDESSIKAAIYKRCPYYDDLRPIMIDRPSSRPLLTSDEISDQDDKRPLSLRSVDDKSSVQKWNKKRSAVSEFIEIRSKAMKIRESHQQRQLEMREIELDLMKKRHELDEEQAAVDLALAKEKLKEIQIKSKIQLLLARKQMSDAGVPQDEIDKLLSLS